MRVFYLLVNELRLIVRDKRALILLYLLPALLVFILSGILSHLYENQSPRLDVLFVSQGNSQMTELVAQEVKGSQKSVVIMNELPSDAVERFDVAIVIPQDLPELLQGQETGSKVDFVFFRFMDPFQKTFLMKEFARILQAQVIMSINEQLQKNADTSSLRLVTDPMGLLNERVGDGARFLAPLSFSLASWSLFAIFFVVIPFSNAFYRDWNNHIFLRLKSMGVSLSDILSGRLLAFLIINFTQFAFLLLLSLYVFPHFLGSSITVFPSSLPFLAINVLAASAAATAFALLVSCCSRTQEQASALGAFSVVILSLLGGVMIPSVFMPERVVQFISVFSPLYWGLAGFAEAFQQEPHSQLFFKSITVLLFFALVFYTLSLRFFRWSK